MRRSLILLVLLASCARGPSGTALPAIKAVTPSGFEAKLVSLRGKPLVVNYWATWCDPCKAEMPRLAAAAKSYTGRVAFLGVDVQDDAGAAARFAHKDHVPYESVGDPRREIFQKQSFNGLPVTQFYDASGKRVSVHQGEIKPDELKAEIEKLLKT